MLATISDNCDNVLAFLQAVAVKSPHFTAKPLPLLTDKCAHAWFCCWTDTSISTLPKLSSQDHMDLTGILTDVATSLKTVEALRPVVSAQSEAKKETKGWDRLPPTAQRIILVARSTNGTSIPTSPPPTIHRFLNASNVTSLQADCALTYAGNNLYLQNAFCQALLQGQILAIPDSDAPTGISPFLTLTYSTGPANAQKRSMRIPGPLIKRGSGQATGPEVPRPRVQTRTETLDEEIYEVGGGLPCIGEPDYFINGDVAVSY